MKKYFLSSMAGDKFQLGVAHKSTAYKKRVIDFKVRNN